MSQQDLTADMLTRIRNAVRNHAPTVSCLNNKLNRGIAQVLTDEGFVDGFDVIDDGRQGRIDVHLRYGERGENVINSIKRESKPGRRIYRSVDDIPRPLFHSAYDRTPPQNANAHTSPDSRLLL